MSIEAIAECWGRLRVHRRDSRPAAARRHAAPPCSRGRFRLSPAFRQPGSGCFFEPVGVVQPAEDGGADDLGSLRQSTPDVSSGGTDQTFPLGYGFNGWGNVSRVRFLFLEATD